MAAGEDYVHGHNIYKLQVQLCYKVVVLQQDGCMMNWL